MNENEVKKLYTALLSKGYSTEDLGDEATFKSKMSDQSSRKQLYDWVSKKNNFRLGDYDKYESRLTSAPETEEPILAQEKANNGVIEAAEEQNQIIQHPTVAQVSTAVIQPMSKPVIPANVSVNGKLRQAMKERDEISNLLSARGEELREKYENKSIFQQMLTGMQHAEGGYQDNALQTTKDDKYMKLSAALRQKNEQIAELENQKAREQGESGFWRSFGKTMADPYTWLQAPKIADAVAMVGANTGASEEDDVLLQSTFENQQTQAEYAGNADFWERAGMMTGHMPAFMVDFMSTGGGFKGMNALSKVGTKLATKAVGKEVAEQIAKDGIRLYLKNNGVKGFGRFATDWTIKALGTTADDLLVRAPLMTNTVQAASTVADIVGRKLGNVEQNEDGTYSFNNEKSLGDAIWQGEANAIIENYSEMFGAHLDKAYKLKNIAKLANFIGAKKIGKVLAKASASELGGIMGKTNELFNQMGVSDYFGEVSEEYYGQLWRTMLNLDDAYQENEDGTRTNLFKTGQFHGDILGGMALSMGMMGAGKTSITAINYTSMKHGINKADARANEVLGKDVWEPMKETIDLTTNEEIGNIAEGIVNDKDLSNEGKAAALDYLERSMKFRGFNLATIAQKRSKEVAEASEELNESYMDGYNAAEPQEMNDAKNMYDYQREKIDSVVDEDMLEMMDTDPVAALNEMRGSGIWNDEAINTAIDYLNAKAVKDGMMQRVRDDIDSRVDQSNAMINSRINKSTGMIQGATMKNTDRKVYVVAGNLKQYDDKSGVENDASDKTIIIKDAETGKLEQVSPESIFNIDDALDPEQEKLTAAEAIRQQFAQEAANKIDGVVSFNLGDKYTITGDDGQAEVTVVANEQGIIDNGDGTINVTRDGKEIFPLSKEVIQQQVDEANKARARQFDEERRAKSEETHAAKVEMNDQITFLDEGGNEVSGVVQSIGDDGIVVEVGGTDADLGRPTQFKAEDLYGRLTSISRGGNVMWQKENENTNETELPKEEQPPMNSAVSKVPTNDQGKLVYEAAEPGIAWDALVEQSGDEEIAASIANDIIQEQEKELKDAEKELKKLQESKPKDSGKPMSIEERIAAKKAEKAALEEAQKRIDTANQNIAKWKQIADTKALRQREAEAEQKRIAEEKAAAHKAEEEKAKAEQEKAEQMEREALNGVPDMVDDTPQAREIKATSMFQYFTGTLSELIAQAKQSAQGLIKKVVAPISTRLKNDLNSQGLQIDDDYNHVIDNNAIRHILKKHSGKNEEKRGQIPITDSDFENIADVVEHYDDVEVVPGNTSAQRIIYHKAYQDGSVIFVEEQRVGRKELAAVTMWKKKIPNLTDANRTETTQISDLTEVSGNKDTKNSPESDGLGEKIDTEEDVLSSRVEVLDDDREENNGKYPTYKRSIVIDGKHTVIQVDEPNEKGEYTGSYFEYDGKRFAGIPEVVGYIDSTPSLNEKVAEAEKQVDTKPTEKQKEAGNYKKGHVQVGKFDITIEQPKGSVRSGVDANGNKWETKMQNTYGYIRGTEGVDGDHIDVFLSDDIDSWDGQKVFVVDQYNEDGSFDEHKVMLGFNSQKDAEAAYFANYDKDWAKKHKTVVTGVKLEDFEKWIDSSHRKTKAFAEYASVKVILTDHQGNPVNADGSLLVEKIESINELTDEDFLNSFRNVQLPTIPKKVADAIGTNGKPVVIKKNIFEKNRKGHKDVTPEQGREILLNALYNPTMYEQNRKTKRPYNWILIHNAEKHSSVVLEVNHNKDNVEIVNWHYLEDDTLEQKKRQAINEGGLILTLESAAGNTINDLSSESKGNKPAAEKQGDGKKSSESYSITPAQYTTKIGKVLDMQLVTLHNDLQERHRKLVNTAVKGRKGWWDKEKNGYMMRSLEDAEWIAEYAVDLQSQPPLDLADLFKVNDGEVQFTEPTTQKTPAKQGEKQKYTPVWQYSVSFDKETGYTTLTRDDVSGPIPIGDAKFRISTNSPEEMLELVSNPKNFSDDVRDAVQTTIENHIKIMDVVRKERQDRKRRREELKENGYNGYKIGDEVVYKGEKAKIHDFEEFGEHNPVLDTGLSPVMYEVAEWDEIKKSEEQQKTNPSGNRLVSDERYAELRERMRKKLLGQMNIGIDPEILAIGTEMAVYHLEKGARKFADYASAMITDLGDAIRPYLKAFYNGARDLPEVAENGLSSDMTSYEEVQKFDVANFDKTTIDAVATAETVAREADVEQEVEIAKHRIKKTQSTSKKNEKKDVSSNEQMVDSSAEESADLHRKFALTVKSDMLAALESGDKPYRSIVDLRKRAKAIGLDVDNEGRTDILLQELVEDGLVRAAKEVASRYGSISKKSYDAICKLYDMQPTIAARSSNRIKMQQYSTPLPMAWIADRFAMYNNPKRKVLEPTAGNGMLVFAIPSDQVHANELDETRLSNLREQGFGKVTQQDATKPFDGGKQYDAVVANPPFGQLEAAEYDGKMIPGLDPQITLNALSSMKDDGRAAIIIGGNMEYADNGAIKSMKPFFTYLYDHYNVKGVIDMSGGLYAKQGTTYPTRMILIEGRRSEEERSQTVVYPPVESKAIRKAESFEELFGILNEVLNSNNKTNGTEILRSQGGRYVPITDNTSGESDGDGHHRQSNKNDGDRSRADGRRPGLDGTPQRSQQSVLGERGQNDTTSGTTRRTDTTGEPSTIGRGLEQRTVGDGNQRVEGLEIQRGGGLKQEQQKRSLSEEKLPYRPHNTAFSLESVAPAAMVEAMDNVLTQIETQHGSIDEFVKEELGYSTIEEAHQALAAEQMDSVAMAIYQMKQGQALIIGDQTGVGKGRQMAALIRWAVKQGTKPIFITQKADLFSDIYRDLVDVGSGDLVPFIFNSANAIENKGEMVDANGKVVHRSLPDAAMKKVLKSGKLPDNYDFAVLTYSQVNTGDAISQEEMGKAAKKNGTRVKKSKAASSSKDTPKATFLRAIARDNYLFLDESHTAAGTSNTGAYLQSIVRNAKAVTFASATFAKRPDTMPLYAIRTAMSKAKVESDKMINIIEKGGVTLQEIMSRELTNAGQMVRRERDMSDVVTDWKTITDPETVKRARENYDRTIKAFNAIVKFQEDYVKPVIKLLSKEVAVMAQSAGVKKGTNKLGVENVPFASKTYNYTKQLMLALKVDAIANEVEAEIKAGHHPVIALESTMESSIKDYEVGETIDEPTFSASLLRGLKTVMQYTIKDGSGKEKHYYYTPKELGPAGEKAYYELEKFIRESTSDIFISPLDAIIERLHEKGYKVGELTGRNMYVEKDDKGRVIVKRRTDKDKKKMQRDFNSGALDVLILNKSASTGISLHASEKFSDQRQRSMIIAQPLSDINDYMQMIGRIDRTGQVHRGYYINLGLPVPAENRFLMMLSTKLKSLNANTTTSQDSESNDVEAPDLLNKYGSQVVVEYLRDNVDVYEKMGSPLKKNGSEDNMSAKDLDGYKPQEDDARKITGYVALLTTKEQEEFYNDVVRRYNELIKYLNDTGNNDLKITVMPLRAKTLERKISSSGIDPDGNNPFAKNSYVEKVEMDVLRKPMKAEDIRKTIAQINKGLEPSENLKRVSETIQRENEAKVLSENERYEKSKAKATEDVAKQTEKINNQTKRTEEEKREAIESYTDEVNEGVEAKHKENLDRIFFNQDQLLRRLKMFQTGKSYLIPDNLESGIFDFTTPAIFCGYKTKDSKITASTTLAVFATLDGRRRIEVKLSQD